MNVELAVQRPKGAKSDRLRERLAARVAAASFDQLAAAAAYVTIEGVNAALESFQGKRLASSRWLVGLDDAISQPGAIDLLRSMPNTTVRVASFTGAGARFHTKVLHLSSSESPTESLLMLGSANLTRAAFESNAEAVAFLGSDDAKSAALLLKTFDEVWKLGRVPTAKELNDYRTRYETARKLRKKLDEYLEKSAPPCNVIAAPDEALLDPSLASVCWIECGRITLMGRELELKAIQARFFGLTPTGGQDSVMTLLHPDGSSHATPFKFRGNSMWRVMFPTSIPEVAKGLRPLEKGGTLGRSPYVAVFERTPKKTSFRLRFLHEDSKDYAALLARSAELGTLGDTGKRRFGWS